MSPNENQGKCNVSWNWDKNFINAKTDNFGAIIDAVNPGSTFIKAECNGIVSTCIIHIAPNGEEAYKNPYIYSNDAVVQMQPQRTYTVTASLFGGSVSEMEDFVWSIEDSSIADISYARNNCVISSKKAGSTKLVCSHPNSKYDYTFIIFVYKDKLTESYITTDYNVLTVDKNEETKRTVKVDLINPPGAAYKNGFTWNYSDEQSKEIINFNANLDTAVIEPLKNGVAKLTVIHEDAQFPLEIIVRVTTIVKNVYINLSQSTVVLNDSESPSTVTATVSNYAGYVEPDAFQFVVPPEASVLAEVESVGNTVRILGKKNGTFKITVKHPLAEYDRNILVILQNQAGSAVDSSMYITTDQNYVQTQVGKPATIINVSLIGGIEGEDNIGDETTNFSWSIENGDQNALIDIEEVTGIVKARSAVSSGNSCSTKLVIVPKKEGEMTITWGNFLTLIC